MVMALVVTVSIVGAGVIQMSSSELRQSATSAVTYKLEALARMGLEANYSMLRSMGTSTQLVTTGVGGNVTVVPCGYFPRTDDAKLPSENAASYEDTTLISSSQAAGPSVSCENARADHPALAPKQLARFDTYTNADIHDTGNLLDPISNPAGAGSDVESYRSVFAWVRYRPAPTMDQQYGAQEGVYTQINQCGLLSQFRASSPGGNSEVLTDPPKRDSLRVSPISSFGNQRLMLFTVKDEGVSTWRLVSCAWSTNSETAARVTKSIRFRVMGFARPETLAVLPY